VPLGGLALGGAVLALAAVLANFLAYGTTSRTARLYGAGRRADAVAEGVQSAWLAVGLGVGAVVVVQLAADPMVGLLAGRPGPVHTAAVTWLRIAVFGLPGVLLALSGNGWMRGVQEVRRPVRYVLLANAGSALLCPLLVYPAGLGLAGSALANVAAQAVSGTLFVRALLRERVPLRPRWALMRAQLLLARDLVIRVVALQAAFLSAAAVAARMGAAQIAAHQIALQLWSFLALVLDAYAIAAQALVGGALGAARPAEAREVAWRVTRLGGATGTAVAVVLLAGWWAIPRLFTADPAVLAQAHVAWPWFALMQPAAGVVFALDGVLVGAGDVGFMRTITVVAGLGGFAPLTWLSYLLSWGLGGVWAGLTVFIGVRLVGMVLRVRGHRWLAAGARA